jgi:hypothetical protein
VLKICITQPDEIEGNIVMIPTKLIIACEKNKFAFNRDSQAYAESAFDKLKLNKKNELFVFCESYCLQFLSDKIDYELLDFIEYDGAISDNVFFAREELLIPHNQVPISSFEAGSIYTVDVDTNGVFVFRSDDSGNLVEELVDKSFFNYMEKVLS